MICKYCGSRLKPGETVCRKCGKQQDSMVQMKRFNDEMYTAQIPYGESGNGTDGPESRIIQSCMFPEQEWNMLFHSVREEQKRSRSFRRKMFVCFFIVIIINIVLLLSCIRLNLRLNSTEQSVQDYRSAWEEQTEKDEQEEAERLRQEEEEKRQQELEDQESQQNWDGGNEQDGEQDQSSDSEQDGSLNEGNGSDENTDDTADPSREDSLDSWPGDGQNNGSSDQI